MLVVGVILVNRILVSGVDGTGDGTYDDVRLLVAIVYQWKWFDEDRPVDWRIATTRLDTIVDSVEKVWERIEYWKIQYDVAISDIRRKGGA